MLVTTHNVYIDPTLLNTVFFYKNSKNTLINKIILVGNKKGGEATRVTTHEFRA